MSADAEAVDTGAVDSGHVDTGVVDTGPRAVILFDDRLVDPGPWMLAADPMTSPGSTDTATATMVSGTIRIAANQEFGCPEASATRSMRESPPPANTELELELVLSAYDRSVQGNASFELGYGGVRFALTFRGLRPLVQATTIRIRGGQQPTATIDGAPLDGAEFVVENAAGAPTAVTARVRACAADAYAYATMSIDRMRLTAMP